jgi:LmbE family N-acetylglucosaminyl deacetylase
LPHILENHHPIAMRKLGRFAWTFVLGVLLCVALPAQVQVSKDDPVDPLPQDTGVAGLKQMLLRLHTTARLMQTVAHPDDEDGGLLTLESRGHGVTTLLLTLNRGEGGQNKLGSNLFDVLGVLRTLELTAADRYYGVEQRFTRVADFGYSKIPEETFQKWQGHDIPLGDMVRVIRTFRPDVLVARFSGTDRDGHGHHQASSILTKEAFRAAADPNRFPEQIKEGLLPWQAKKLYIGNVCGFGATTCPAENYTVKLSTGERSAALGMTYIQFSVNQGLRHQLSQGAGGWEVDPGPHYAYYKLVDSVVTSNKDKDGHEQDLFDGIDTTLPGLASRLGAEETRVPFLSSALKQIETTVAEATAAAEKDPLSAVAPLEQGSRSVADLILKIKDSSLSPEAKSEVLPSLQTKASEFVKAIALAAGAQLAAVADVPLGSGPDTAFMAVPGQAFEVTATFSSALPALKSKPLTLDLPRGWKQEVLSNEHKGNEEITRFKVSVPADAQYTRPYWHRDNPETDSINTIDDPQYLTLPFPPPPVKALAFIGDEGKISAPCVVRYKNADGTESKRALAVAPPFSMALEPTTEVIPTGHDGTTEITVGIRSNVPTSAPARLRLELPRGWSAEPDSQPVRFDKPGESKDFSFQVRPSNLREGHSQIKAALDYQHKTYDLGYTVVTREDLDTFYYYQPAVQRVSIVDVKVPHDLKVGYVMGAGDDIPTVLKQIGMNVTMIAAESLASTDLSGYGTIVLGIRAYDTQKDVVVNNKKLLDYVSAGGTLLVQYDTGVSDFNGGHFTPYPAQLSRARVSVEEAPVEILDSTDSALRYPNQITQHDFDGWVQERGLYFMGEWDSHFKPLLASHDPGEPLLKGGLLRAQYGKGTYIYTGYAFFRQLPAGVPGAIRLYVNLLSAGHEKTVASRQ